MTRIQPLAAARHEVTTRATPYAALKAITEHAAYQDFEERSEGTLEPGKLADLVILDRNPLKVPRGGIEDIVMVETIEAGRSVFVRDGQAAPAR